MSSHKERVVLTMRVHDLGMKMHWLRWVLVALGAALAVVLVLHGNVVIGVLIGAMAAVRVVLVVQVQRRRRRWRGRGRGRVDRHAA